MLIGLDDAAQKIGVSREAVLRTLRMGGVPLVQLGKRAFAVEEKELIKLLERRSGYSGFGRPAKAEPRKKPK